MLQSEAGQTLAALARRQRLRAMLLAGGMGISLSLLLIVDFILRDLSKIVRRSLAFPSWLYLICLAITLVIGIWAAILWLRADSAQEVAIAEARVGQVLSPLEWQGWQIRYDVWQEQKPHPQIGGHVILVDSPRLVAFMLVVKPQRGRVRWAGKHLVQWSGKTWRSLDAHLLHKIRQQAIALQAQTGKSLLIPVLVFAHGRVEVPHNPLARVYVVDRKSLVNCLQLLG